MNIVIEKLPKERWSELEEMAHLHCFKEIRDSSWDKSDFALTVLDEGKFAGYVTCHEIDKESAHIQFGGIFNNFRGKGSSSTYVAFIQDKLVELGFKVVTLNIENTNSPMIKCALNNGFTIFGVRYRQEKIYLELIWDKP